MSNSKLKLPHEIKKDFLNICKENGLEFYLVKMYSYHKFYIWAYNPEDNQNLPFDPTDPVNQQYNQYRNRKLTSRNLPELVRKLDDFDLIEYFENNINNKYDIIFSDNYKGKIFTQLYKQYTNEKRPNLLRSTNYFVTNNSSYDFVNTIEVFKELANANINIKELKKIWNSISKRELQFSDSYNKDLFKYNDFIVSLFENLPKNEAHELTLHIIKNRMTQINSNEIIGNTIRDTLTSLYEDGNPDLIKEYTFINKINDLCKNENKDTFLEQKKYPVITTSIDYSAINAILRIPNWTVNHYALWLVELKQELKNLYPDIEKISLIHHEASDKKTLSSSRLYVCLKDQHSLTFDKLNKTIEDYFQFILSNYQYATQHSTKDKNNVNQGKRSELVKTWILAYKMNQDLEVKKQPKKTNKI